MTKERPQIRQRRSPDSEGDGTSGRGPMPWVLLGTAALLVAVGAYYAIPKSAPPKQPTPSADTLEQEVMDSARGLLESGGRPKAVELMQVYVDRVPNDTNVRLLLAETLLTMKQYERADRILGELLTLQPNSPAALWAKGRLVRCIGGKNYMDFFRRGADSPEAGPDYYVRYAELLLSAGQIDSAEHYFVLAAKGGRRDASVNGGLGLIALARKDYPRAAKLLSAAIADAPENPRYYAALAETQLAEGKIDSADATLKRALDRCRRQGDLAFWLGRVRQRQGRLSAAAEAYAEAAWIGSRRAEAAKLAAESYYQLQQYAEAMKYIDLAIEAGAVGNDVETLKEQIENARFGGPINAPSNAG